MPALRLKVGTRGSKLALWQAEWLRAELARRGVQGELVVIKTQGDADVDRPLHQLEGKGFFTKEIEAALLDARIDVAVHSLKDLPTQLPDGLALAAIPLRHDPCEALVSKNGATSLATLPVGARIGTSSLRRVSQLHYLRADLDVVPLRGNVPTRVEKVRGGPTRPSELDAALLAVAGLERLALGDAIAARLDPLEIMPAPGQGALGIEIRANDARTRQIVAQLEDRETAAAVRAERAVLAALGGGCQAPVAAYVGTGEGGRGTRRLYGRVTAEDGSVQLTASAEINERHPEAGGEAVAHLLETQGAGKLLAR